MNPNAEFDVVVYGASGYTAASWRSTWRSDTAWAVS